ncbi:AAA family ATPase [Microcoleus vaginatus DQ-U2]|uniref:hybrid sensor histidine kinase/response regulator n=1 Tax=Microcoleus vaginatus TaxID=119532 RepID=UPI001682E7E3|nr:AAA family ATPase [Microcoleus sp. FACHB-DQ6]
MTINLAGYQFVETLHSGIRTSVDRARKDSDFSSVIVKRLKAEYPTLSDITRLRHEYQILHSLNVESIIKAISLESYKNGLALILEDSGSESLNDWMKGKKISIIQFLSLALQLVSALAELHKHNIIHKDVKPQNIIINPATEKVKIIDFSIASRLERENSTLSHPDLLEGTLAYMSPEQTGRMNRSIDYRTDFYSLGVTFYEMLTGELPFNSTDPLELVHSHIAKTPIPPHQLNHEIPPQISAIAMKLLAKNAEDRYQSTEGLKFDLETCLIKLQASGYISNFVVGSADKAGQLNIPQKLYGRYKEIEKILETFERVASGTTELMLVSGYSGIGKTVLVNEVHKPIVRQRGYFIAGKFDQFKRNIPYASLIQAFQSLTQQLLTEGEVEIQTWKEKLLSALGDNGQVIIDVIPEVELIIGKQPPVAELGATEAQNRFSRVFKQFIGVFTTIDHPLVIFLDDLQWADSASLKLIELLITDSDSKYLLLIGAYRDNEVSPTHPTIQTIDKIRQTGATVNNIVLQPLHLVHVEELIADTLNESGGSESLSVKTRNFASLLFNKTQGNPFFLSQLLKTLYQEDLLTYNFTPLIPPYQGGTKGGWQWNIEEIQAIGITDYNVVELIARNIRKLPEDTQKVLKFAACIGNTFNLEVLAIVNQESSLVTAGQLWAALQAGLILPLSNEYKIPLVFSQEESGGFTLTDVKVDYKFLHDRVQQAAYSLIPDEQKKETHLKIGQLLLQSTTPEDRKENIFALVNQLNYGTDLLTTESQKYELAQLNLIAGQKAKAATAHDSAVKYLQVGLSLLAVDSWDNRYELALRLHEEAAESAYLSGDFDRMQRFVEIVQNCAKTLLDIVKVYEVQIQAYMAQNKLVEALNTGLQVLKQLEVEFPDSPNPSDIGQALGETAAILSGTRIEDLIDLPEMTDPYQLAAIRILSSIFSACYSGMPVLVPLTVCKQVDLSVQYGNASVSPFAYAVYSLLLCGAVGDIERGYEFGQLALRLVSKLNAKEIEVKTCHLVYAAVQHWKEHVRNTLEPFLAAFSTGLETGDLEYAGYAVMVWSHYSFFVGKQLMQLEREIATYTDALHKISQETAINNTKICWQAVLNIMGRSENICQLKGEVYDEEKMLPLYQETNNQLAIHYLYLHKLALCYVFENYAEALKNIPQVESSFGSSTGQLTVVIFYFYDSLVRLAVYPESSQPDQQDILNRVQANQEKMQKWAHYAPMNHLHKFYLVEAEKNRVLGETVEAIEMYDKAIALAKENEYINEEALAHELAAKFYFSWGKEKIARTYMTDAYYAYMRWGALAKVKHLEEKYPKLIARASAVTETPFDPKMTIAPLTITGGQAELLDLATVMKASIAISSEIVLPNLLTKLMKILIENAGAETGVLILSKDGQLVIEAAGTKDRVRVLESLPVSNSGLVPISVLNYVTRTQKDVVLNDSGREEIFNADPYITQHKPKSILCAPILYQGKLTAILYLENNVIAGAFTPKRVEVLRMLSGQAAIALENANLYHTLEVKVEERTEELKAKNTSLEVEIQERQRAEQAAEAANRAKSQFLANMSHELRTPLNGILGYTQILKRDTGLTSQQNSGINIIHQCGEHLLTLINDVLDLSKIEAGKMELYLTEFHLSDFLQGITEICQIRAQQKGISLIYEPLTSLPTCVQADEKRLRQILINLLGNAIKFTEKGGVIFKVDRLETQQSLPSPIANPQSLTAKFIFQVEDTGIGIAPDELSKIFLPFEQASGSVSQIEGTGLGLPISRQLVEMMGGELKVQSSLGKGSIFWFELELPITESWEGYQKEPEKIIRSFSGERRKILVVDDRWQNRSVLVNLLAPIGFELMEATDGQDCVNKALLFQPDCIIIDLVMPVMDGFEAVRRIRKIPTLKDVIAIGTSASILSGDPHSIFQAGCNAFLLKPIRAEKLLECLGNHLGLEWVYEERTTFSSGGIFTDPPSQIQDQQLIAPPSEEVAVLFDLAMKGELLSIEKRASKLKAIDMRYAPFVNQLLELTKNFEEDKLVEFVQQFR